MDNNTHMSKVLGPMHIWALGVGIVVVGEFMGWNFAIAKGGSLGAIAACWIIGVLYICLIMINAEMGCIIPEAGGQYAMAKYFLGPLAAFNVGLMLVFEYVMLEAADALVVGEILKSLSPEVSAIPYVILSLLALTYLNYRGVYATLTLNFVITAIAFVTIFVLLFSTRFYSETESLLQLKDLTNGLPYGWMGIIGALQFGIWFYLGIEGTTLAAEECKSTSRALPLGAIIGIITLIVGASTTWLVCSGLVEAEALGSSVYPLFDAARAVGNPIIINALFAGTVLACLASANGCVTDSSRAWFSMARDNLLPDIFGVLHPKYKTPYRAILFLLPIAIAFGYTGMLDQVISFSILSAILVYIMSAIMMIKFRNMYPLGTIQRGYISPFHPLPAIIVFALAVLTLIGMYFGYWINLLSGFAFYFLASVWFKKRREKYIDCNTFIDKNITWGKPEGY